MLKLIENMGGIMLDYFLHPMKIADILGAVHLAVIFVIAISFTLVHFQIIGW